jgi:hypothetical protein
MITHITTNKSHFFTHINQASKSNCSASLPALSLSLSLSLFLGRHQSFYGYTLLFSLARQCPANLRVLSSTTCLLTHAATLTLVASLPSCFLPPASQLTHGRGGTLKAQQTPINFNEATLSHATGRSMLG